jgi:hypothetical protein
VCTHVRLIDKPEDQRVVFIVMDKSGWSCWISRIYSVVDLDFW